jgi:hypothetical protein
MPPFKQGTLPGAASDGPKNILGRSLHRQHRFLLGYAAFGEETQLNQNLIYLLLELQR